MKTEDILSEREKTHGEYKHTARLSWRFKHIIRAELDEDMRRNVDIWQQEALEMIVHKIARIVCGDPNFVDHWDDIAGYAMLGKGEKNEEKAGVTPPKEKYPSYNRGWNDGAESVREIYSAIIEVNFSLKKENERLEAENKQLKDTLQNNNAISKNT